MGNFLGKEKNPDVYTRQEINNLLAQIIINQDEANLIYKDSKQRVRFGYKDVSLVRQNITVRVQDVNKIHLLPSIQQLTIANLPCDITKTSYSGSTERATLFKDKLHQEKFFYVTSIDKKSGLNQLEYRDDNYKFVQYCIDFINFAKWELSVTVQNKRPFLTMRRDDLMLQHELACFPNQEIELSVEGPNKRLIVFTNFTRSLISKFVLEIDNKQTRVAVTYENNELKLENDDEKLCYVATFTKSAVGFIIKNLTLYKDRCKDESLNMDIEHALVDDLLNKHRIHLNYDMFNSLQQCEDTFVQFNTLLTNLLYIHNIV